MGAQSGISVLVWLDKFSQNEDEIYSVVDELNSQRQRSIIGGQAVTSGDP